jgi:hypothetical protein
MLKPSLAVVTPSAVLLFPGCSCGGFAVFSSAEPSAGQDFRGSEISMADNSLQKTAITAGRGMWLPTRPLA